MVKSPRQFRAIVYDSFVKQWLSFQNPSEIFTCNDFSSVQNVLLNIEESTTAGHYALGFLSYEAAPAFDSAHVVKSESDFPLAVFAIFDQGFPIDLHDLPVKEYQLGHETRSINKSQFYTDLDRIKNYIAHGDTYQVNFTHRLYFDVAGDALSFFRDMATNAPPHFTAFFEWNDVAVCSISPELFFKLNGDRIISKPMKGTRPRGRFWQEDQLLKDELFESEKDRAENVMIVDMIRNDLGRIAATGSVAVESLYDIEKYPTVWQMTSTVSAKTDADLLSILKSLFPCASITGAPKVRTMQIINELETTPRKIYTGTIGLLKPNRQYQFNVAIRTLVVDKKMNTAEYGVGSGIVWDSDADSEWQECLVKSRVVRKRTPNFELLETMLYEPDDGIFLVDYHLARFQKSADYFDYPFDLKKIKRALDKIDNQNARQKIRLLLAKTGSFRIEQYDQPKAINESVRLKLAQSPIDSQDIFLFHKTTHRKIYEDARRTNPDCDDVILWNEQNEITETTINNIIVKIDQRYYTPPIECGLLGGTFRAWLLDRGEVHERILMINDLKKAEVIYVVNSVQGKRQAVLLSE